MVAQLVHVWVVLGHDGDGVTLLANDETSLLLRSVPQVYSIVLIETEKCDFESAEHEGCSFCRKGFEIKTTTIDGLMAT